MNINLLTLSFLAWVQIISPCQLNRATIETLSVFIYYHISNSCTSFYALIITQKTIMSHVRVTINGVLDWRLDLLTTLINDSWLHLIIAPLLISTLYKSLQHMLSLCSLLCLHQSFPGKSSQIPLQLTNFCTCLSYNISAWTV
jgi:hypothetical protein